MLQFEHSYWWQKWFKLKKVPYAIAEFKNFEQSGGETWGVSAWFLQLQDICEFRGLYLRMPLRQSGLQRDVLKLCRDLHRAARKKDPDNSHNFTAFGEISFWLSDFSCIYDQFDLAFIIKPSAVMKEFRIKAASVSRTDFKTIEHLLRYGYKQKKLIEMPGFRSGSVTSTSTS